MIIALYPPSYPIAPIQPIKPVLTPHISQIAQTFEEGHRLSDIKKHFKATYPHLEYDFDSIYVESDVETSYYDEHVSTFTVIVDAKKTFNEDDQIAFDQKMAEYDALMIQYTKDFEAYKYQRQIYEQQLAIYNKSIKEKRLQDLNIEREKLEKEIKELG